jgi:uncharacterized protein
MTTSFVTTSPSPRQRYVENSYYRPDLKIYMMNKFNTFELVAITLLIVGGVNWGMVGALDFNLVSYLFGNMTFITRAVYVLVGLSAIYIAFSTMFKTDTASSINHAAILSR